MRLNRLLKKLNWRIYVMELFIVILGISIAYQLNIVYENGVNKGLEMTALRNLHQENEINIKEFNSLEAYRIRITSSTQKMLDALLAKGPLNPDSTQKYIIHMVQTSTPDLQQEASNFYLSSNYGNTNIKLKNELLTLKTYLQELIDLSDGYKDRKLNDFMLFLRTAVDFPRREIVDLNKINSLEFRNIIWNQNGDEHELNRLYTQAREQLLKVQQMVEEIIKEDE